MFFTAPTGSNGSESKTGFVIRATIRVAFAMKDEAESELLSQDTLADIQGCITRGFGHLHHSAYMFVRLGAATRAKIWLRHVLRQWTDATAGAPAVHTDRTLKHHVYSRRPKGAPFT
jgi:hypothetical protein